MKRIVKIFLISFYILSCQKEDELTVFETNQPLIGNCKVLPQKGTEKNNKPDEDIFNLENMKTVTIPVYFHILYNSKIPQITSSDIRAQMDALNKAFSGKDHGGSPLINVIFNSVKTKDTKIRFVLEEAEAKHTNQKIWSFWNDFKKYPNPRKKSEGGLDPVNPWKNLNIWVIDGLIVVDENDVLPTSSINLGLSSNPIDAGAEWDGIAINSVTFPETNRGIRAFLNPISGKIKTMKDQKGKNLVHEVGHYLGLHHLIGKEEMPCGDDFVADTPPAEKLHKGTFKLPFKETCNGKSNYQMVVNYMDYSDESMLYIFTKGQTERMWRQSFWGKNAERKLMAATLPK
ncbi:M43 family zinc metalloprotease [Flavobacterium sp.]|uniref:M43 family zinc metalloprotease n=1 Tax=Flavobacterium sp. TaxID=239 RepID=UPI003D0D47B7